MTRCPICQDEIDEQFWICQPCMDDMPMNYKMAIAMFKGDITGRLVERWQKTGHWDGRVDDPSQWEDPIKRFKPIKALAGKESEK